MRPPSPQGHLFCNETPITHNEDSPPAGSPPQQEVRCFLILHQCMGKHLGGRQYLLIIPVFELCQDRRMYTYRKPPADLRAIFQKDQEMASEFPSAAEQALSSYQG